MAMLLACPGCGKKQIYDDSATGKSVICSCGMGYTVSSIFAVKTPVVSPFDRFTQSWRGVAVVVLVMGALGGFLAWLTHSTADASASRPPLPKPPPTSATTEPPLSVATSTPASKPAPPEPEPKPPEPRAKAKAPPSPQQQPAPSEPPALATAPDRLFDAYDEPAHGEAKFGGQWVELTGPVQLGRDADGKPYLGFVIVEPRNLSPAELAKLPPHQQDWERHGYPPSVRCYLADRDIAPIQGTTTATVRGSVRGRRDDASAYMGYVVIVDSCRVVK